jgi:hypothetical protein
MRGEKEDEIPWAGKGGPRVVSSRPHLSSRTFFDSAYQKTAFFPIPSHQHHSRNGSSFLKIGPSFLTNGESINENSLALLVLPTIMTIFI